MNPPLLYSWEDFRLKRLSNAGSLDQQASAQSAELTGLV